MILSNLRILTFLFIVASLIGCREVSVPKPRGHFRIDLPKRQYVQFDEKKVNDPNIPVSFEYPVYGNILRDTAFFGDKPENPYWINIDFPRFRARIYISYKKVEGNYDKLREDAYKMTYKHTYKASSIEDSLISTPLGVHGIFFNVGGNAATAKQFFVSDSIKHFLRGALYFDTTPNSDSLSIVNAFLQEDMYHLINTLRWKN